MAFPLHGGPDALGAAPHDFSTNVNALGPCPRLLDRLQRLVPDCYPDPSHAALRARLAEWHGVSAGQIVMGGSGSELVFRMTAALVSLARESGAGTGPDVCLPPHAYGDYERAAAAWGLPVSRIGSTAGAVPPRAQPAQPQPAQPQPAQPQLLVPRPAGTVPMAQPAAWRLYWACEPSSPLGQNESGLYRLAGEMQAGDVLVLDCAYAPLRLSGAPSLDAAMRSQTWQLFTPNKALGLSGIRAAYLVAPADALAERWAVPAAMADACPLPGVTAAAASAPADAPLSASGWQPRLLRRLRLLAPSWEIGTHGVAMLHGWTDAGVQSWLQQARQQLGQWKLSQVAGLRQRGWTVLDSDGNYFCARPPLPEPGGAVSSSSLQRFLRQAGIKLRDTASFGLPGWFRLAVRPPADQQALWRALDSWQDAGSGGAGCQSADSAVSGNTQGVR